MRKIFHLNKEALHKQLVHTDFRYFFQLELLCVLLGSVSFFMGIMNIFTHKGAMMTVTMGFAAVCYINLFILHKVQRVNLVSYNIFDVSILSLFCFFLVTGGAAGFSTHWILLLPVCGMHFFGKKQGFIISALMFLITIFLLWSPLGRELLRHEYTSEFCMRFPIVYLAFFLLGYSFELIRSATYHEMVRTQIELTKLAESDVLTGLKNRCWFNNRFLDAFNGTAADTDCLLLLIDIDNFKYINDTYGHPAGDAVLCGVVGAIRSQLNQDCVLCRWGGEEFFAFITDCAEQDARTVCERIRKIVQETSFSYESYSDIKTTISVGAISVAKGQIFNVESILSEIDKRLYEAKELGKNRIQI